MSQESWQQWYDADKRLYNADNKIIESCNSIGDAKNLFKNFCNIDGNMLDDGKLDSVISNLWGHFKKYEEEVRPYVWKKQGE